MTKIIDRVKESTLIAKLAYVALIIALVADVAFIIVDGQDQTFTIGCFVCIILGSLVGLLDLLVDFKLSLWLSALLYSGALAFHLYKGLPSVSDLWNGVNFVGGNQVASIVFGAIFAICTIAVLIANFGELRKS